VKGLTPATAAERLGDLATGPTSAKGDPMAMTHEEPTALTFSEAIKAASWNAHEHAEHSRFMQDLLAGRLDLDAYARLVAQHYFAYRVLEDASRAMADDPVGSRFTFPELSRVPALEADLTALLGADWAERISPTAETTAYCERLSATCFDWPGGYVAHHYVRYMGDLSGGQVIRRIVERTYDLDDHAGTGFYVFDEVGDLKAFKSRYRDLLDDVPWSADERDRVVEEILLAYRLNTDVLEGLGRPL
jgi:heme oxygenase (biliverdin-producing, ferredoxin)